MEKSNQKGIDIPIRESLVILILMAGVWKETAKAHNSLSTMKCLQELKRNSTDKEHLHPNKDFLREQVQINTEATDGLHSKPEVRTKAKRSLKAITYVDQTNEDQTLREKRKETGLTRGKKLL